MSRIRQHDPPLGEPLDWAIRTGIYCAYLPDSRITASWMTERVVDSRRDSNAAPL